MTSPRRIESARFRVVIKQCGCGRAYSRETWEALPFAGFLQKGKDIAGEVLELRHCPCGSSIAIDLGDAPDSLDSIRLSRT